MKPILKELATINVPKHGSPESGAGRANIPSEII
jgi:hypothetical protein